LDPDWALVEALALAPDWALVVTLALAPDWDLAWGRFIDLTKIREGITRK